MSALLDYEVLRVIWWVLLGVLLIGLAIMDGFDMGVGLLLPIIGKTDMERRVMINTVGPVWEGNQVWLLLGGGAIFAAWPTLYATSFSGFYLAMFLLLCSLILRPVGFTFRSKIDCPKWRLIWDTCLFVGGVAPALVFGVAVGNVIQGVPFHFDEEMRVFYTGSFWELFNPFALLVGVISVLMHAMHGANYLRVKTEGVLEQRATKTAKISAFLMVVLYVLAGVWVAKGINAYVLTQPMVPGGPSNPMAKEVGRQVGAWMQNYQTYSWMLLAPVMAIGGALLVLVTKFKNHLINFVFSGISIFGVVSTVGLGMFPFILPSSENPNHSLMVWDSSSSHGTLFLMLAATVILLPIVLAYTAWVYRVLRGKVTSKYIEQNDSSVY